MSRNRKNLTVAGRFGPVVLAALVFAALAGVGWSYLWQKGQIAQLGRQVKERERTLESLRIQNDRLRDNLASMRKPEALLRRITELNLGLSQTTRGQVEFLPEPDFTVPPAPLGPLPIGNQQLAVGNR